MINKKLLLITALAITAISTQVYAACDKEQFLSCVKGAKEQFAKNIFPCAIQAAPFEYPKQHKIIYNECIDREQSFFYEDFNSCMSNRLEILENLDSSDEGENAEDKSKVEDKSCTYAEAVKAIKDANYLD